MSVLMKICSEFDPFRMLVLMKIKGSFPQVVSRQGTVLIFPNSPSSLSSGCPRFVSPGLDSPTCSLKSSSDSFCVIMIPSFSVVRNRQSSLFPVSVNRILPSQRLSAHSFAGADDSFFSAVDPSIIYRKKDSETHFQYGIICMSCPVFRFCGLATILLRR